MPTIQYNLKADTGEFSSGIKGAQSAMAGAANAAGALAAGVLALGASIGALVDQIVGVVDEVNTLSASSGLATSTINGLRLAANATGKAFTDLVPTDLALRIQKAADGGKKMSEAFADLGVKVVDTNGHLRSADEVLRDTIGALTSIEDPTERAAAASAALGTVGQQMLSAFGNTGDLEHFIELGQEFGINTGPAATDAANKWMVATSNLSLAFETAGQSFLDTIGGPGMVAGMVDGFSQGFVFLTELVAQVVGRMLSNLGAIGEAISALFRGDVGGAIEAIGKAELANDLLANSFDAAGKKAFVFFEITKEGAEEFEKAAEDANEPIRILPGLASTAAKAIKDLASAEADLAAIARERRSDQLDAEGQAVAAFLKTHAQIDKEIEKLEELRLSGEATEEALGLAREARFEAAKRFNRELDVIETEQAEIRLVALEESKEEELSVWEEAQKGIAAEAAATTLTLGEEQASRLAVATAAANSLTTTLTTFADLRIGKLQEEAAGLKDRLALEEAQIEALKEEGGAALELAEAKAEATRKEIKNQQSAINRAFNAKQAAAVGSIAIDAAAALLGLTAAFALSMGPSAPIAAAAIVSPMVVAQLAVVGAQKPPKIHDGTANTDEILATIRGGEAIASQRGAEAIGRGRIARANAGLDLGGGGVTQIIFQRRVLDQMMSRTIQGGGKTMTILARGRLAPGVLDPFGGF